MFVAFLPSIIKIQDHFKRFQEVKSIVKSSFESHERIEEFSSLIMKELRNDEEYSFKETFLVVSNFPQRNTK